MKYIGVTFSGIWASLFILLGVANSFDDLKVVDIPNYEAHEKIYWLSGFGTVVSLAIMMGLLDD